MPVFYCYAFSSYPPVKIVIIPKTAHKIGEAKIIRRIQYIISDQSGFNVL